MQVTKGTWRMREQCVPGSLSSSPAREPGNEANFSPAKKPTCAKKSVNDTDTQIQKLKQKMYAVTRNTNKRLKRREKVIDEQNHKFIDNRKPLKLTRRNSKGRNHSYQN